MLITHEDSKHKKTKQARAGRGHPARDAQAQRFGPQVG